MLSSKEPLSPEALPPCATWTRHGGEVVLELSGEWRRDSPAPEVQGEPAKQMPDRYVAERLGAFDSTLPAYLLANLRGLEAPDGEQGSAAKPSLEDLPTNLRGLMELALAVPEQSDARGKPASPSELKKLGRFSIGAWNGVLSIASFIGDLVLALGRFVTGRARFRPGDFWMIVQDCGVQALPIVSLISFLIGMILAFVGNVQLANLGASIYVADLVGIAMVREMGVVMTAIIMSGRTGAAFAAQIGSMKVSQEIDALRTLGFDPFDFLVLPRVLALVLMMPLLTLYANTVGILGGMLVARAAGIPAVLYWNETLAAVTLTAVSLGVFKSFFFGVIIAASGCLQGMQTGNSAAAVGQATTRAVVYSITAIVVLDSGFAAIFTVLDI